MRIRTLLALVFGTILVLTLVRSYWATQRLAGAIERYDALVRGHDDALGALRRVRGIAIDMETAVRGYELTGVDDFLDPYRAGEAELEVALTDFVSMPWTDAGRAHAESAAGLLRAWVADVARPIAEGRTAGTDRTTAQIDGRRRMDAIRAELDRLETELDSTRVAESEGFRTLERDFRGDTTWSGALMLGAVLVLAAFTARKVDAPLAALRRYAESAGRGTHERLDPAGVDEVKEVGRALEHLSLRASTREQRDRALAALNERLASARSLEEIAEAALAHLVAATESIGGCLGTRGPDGAFVPRAALGAPREELAREGSGLAKDAERTGRTQRVELSTGAVVVRSALVDVEPRVLAALPVAVGTRVVAVAELLDPKQALDDQDLVRAISRIALAIQSAEASAEAEALRAEVTATNHELEAQNEELRAQEEELRSQSEALHRSQDALGARNAELERATHAKSEFLSRMSHELRTPLNAVLGFSDLLLDASDSKMSPEERRFIADIHDAGDQLLRLVNDVLDLARIEAGALTVDPRDLDLGLVVREAATMLSPMAGRRSVTLDVSGLSDALGCRADPSRVRQVAVNLIGNAVKFGPDGGRVRITARARGPVARVEVTDDGPGIAEPDVSRLFQPFSQLAAGRARGGGAGLGLSIVKQLVEQMRGSVGVTTTPGHGATFWFELPRVGTTSDVGDARSAETAENGLALVIEDRASDAETIAEVLGRAGYEVRVVASAERALELLPTLAPKIVLVDLGLPGMPGEVLIERLARMLDRVPIVALTARSLTEREREDLARGGAWWVAQKGVMTGAGFLESLGALRTAPHAPRVPTEKASPSPPSALVRVLVVDDVEVNRRVLREMLPQATHVVQAVASAREALAVLATQAFDVVLMDVQMPEMDGLAATRAIHAVTRTKDLPVIAVTAQAMVGDRERALAAGCVSYLAKPVGRAELVAAIAAAVAQSQPAAATVRS